MKKYFGASAKLYIYGQDSIDYAIGLDNLAKKYDLNLSYCAGFLELSEIASKTSKINISAQNVDIVIPGRGMGKILPEALKAAGCNRVCLNHVECPKTTEEIRTCIDLLRKQGIASCVCLSGEEEAIKIANMHPDMICVEEADHIASTTTSSDEYFVKMLNIIKNIDPNIIVDMGGSIKSADDVYHMYELGADSTGATSGIMTATNRLEKTEELLQGLIRYLKEHN